MKKLAASAILLLALASHAVSWADPEPASTSTPATPQELFVRYCGPCHREDGSGNIGPALTSDRKFKYGHDLGSLIRSIRDGHPEHGCPSWKVVLNTDQILDIARYVRTLPPRATKSAAPTTH